MRFSPLLVWTVRGDSLAPVLLVLGVLAGAGCENKAIGRPCDLLVDAGTNKATVTQALECPTRICVLPALHPSRPETDTEALCSAECSSDEDCEDGEKGNPNNRTRDKRCLNGFACGVATEVGEFCCKKICLCRDFLPDGGVPFPTSCMADKNPFKACQNVR